MDMLKQDIVKVEDYNSYISKQGVIVKLEVTGGRNSYFISPKIYGVKNDMLSDGSKTFIGQHMKDGRVRLIPKELENQLRSKETMLKKKLSEIVIGYNNSFVPIESFKKFEVFFENIKDEYFAIRDTLVDEYEALKSSFIKVTENMISDLNATEAQAEVNQIIKKLPTKEEFYNSFKIEMKVSAFPNVANLDMFDDTIKDRILNSVRDADNSMIKSSITSSINEGVKALISILNGDMNRTNIHPKIKEGIINATERMAEKNIFANPKVYGYIDNIKGILSLNLIEAIAEAEIVLSSLYYYSTELKLEGELDLGKCPLTKQQLLGLYEMYN